MCASHFFINLYISFIYTYIFTKFAENMYRDENMSVKILYTIADCSKTIDMF